MTRRTGKEALHTRVIEDKRAAARKAELEEYLKEQQANPWCWAHGDKCLAWQCDQRDGEGLFEDK